jgi:hypothetical protein
MIDWMWGSSPSDLPRAEESMKKSKIVPFVLSIAMVASPALLRGQTDKPDDTQQQKGGAKGTEHEDGSADPNQALVKHKAHPSATPNPKTKNKTSPQKQEKQTSPPRVPTPSSNS